MPGEIALIVPTLTTPGPAYATQISNDLATIATHTHDGVNAGASIDIGAQVCNEDLSVNGHNLSNVRSLELNNNPAQLTGSQDVNCLYVNANALGFNNNAGIFVPITSGNSLAITSIPLTNFSPRTGTITSNASILYSDTYNLINVNPSGGAITITLPVAAAITPIPAMRLYLFRDIGFAAGTHSITIQVAPASGNTFGNAASTTSFVVNNSGGYVGIYTDGVSKWFVWTQNVYQDENISLQTSDLALTAASNITLDGTSTIQSAGTFIQVGTSGGGIELAAAATLLIQGASQAVWSGAGTAAVWQTGTAETRQSGATETFQSGSTLTLNGTVAGSFLSSVTFTGTFAGAGTSSVLSNVGTTKISGETYAVTVVGGNYTCDTTSGYLDRVVAITTTPSYAGTITLPASPSVGRLITICDGNGTNPSTAPGFSVTLNGNGNSIVQWGGTGGVGGTYSIAAVGGGSPSAVGAQAGWNMTIIWTGSVWALQSAFNLQANG